MCTSSQRPAGSKRTFHPPRCLNGVHIAGFQPFRARSLCIPRRAAPNLCSPEKTKKITPMVLREPAALQSSLHQTPPLSGVRQPHTHCPGPSSPVSPPPPSVRDPVVSLEGLVLRGVWQHANLSKRAHGRKELGFQGRSAFKANPTPRELEPRPKNSHPLSLFPHL